MMKQKSKIILFRIIPIVLIILTFVMLFSTTPSITSNAKTRKLNTNVWNTDLVELKEQETNQTTTGFISITNFYTFSGSNFVASDSTKVTSFQSNMQILIESAEELYCFTLLCNSEYKQQYLSYNYALGSNIDYTDASKQRLFALPIGWVPSSESNIAESKDAFQGTFDGRGFSISNLFYDPIDDEVEYNEKYQELRINFSCYVTSNSIWFNDICFIFNRC